MARRYSRDLLFHRALQVRLLCLLTLEFLHADAGYQPILTLSDDFFIGLKTGVHQSLSFTDLRNRDGTCLYCFVGTDHPDERAVRTLLHGRSRDGQTIVPRIAKEPCINELARPEQALGIGKACAQSDCAGGLDDLVVDEIKLALIEPGLVVLTVSQDGERA